MNFRRKGYDGAVVTHGTDTLEETAYFLDLVLKTEKPVVLTASMRNISELSTDGPRNVLSSVLVASCDDSYGMGVVVCLNDEIHAAREVTKTYTSNVATFDSPGYGPLGLVDENNVIYFRKSLTREKIPTDRVEEGVAVVKTLQVMMAQFCVLYMKWVTKGLYWRVLDAVTFHQNLLMWLKRL